MNAQLFKYNRVHLQFKISILCKCIIIIYLLFCQPLTKLLLFLHAQGVQPKPVQESREYRKVPEERLMARLGLTRYDKDAPLKEELVQVKKVRILLSQHIGAPAQAVVKAGDEVTRGQMIAQPAQGLSVGIHASVSGKVTEVTDRYIIIAVK